MRNAPKPGDRSSGPRGDHSIADSGYSSPILPPVSYAQDRAAVVATSIIALIFRSPTPRDLRVQIEALLRDELADVERSVLADTRLADP
jgi:hypothetical protein